MTYEFGDVLLIPFPFTDQSTTKKRPAVVISSNHYNRRYLDVILMAISSQMQATAYSDNLVIQDWQSAGLLKPSVIKPIITTVETSLILRKLGILAMEDQQALNDLLARILGT
ncbi:MAG: type II toxin-antitoxin system PemK/MazF family toxin [Cyanothece sp. SIO1E1]|nr:type II toxin-antitoxin system PemK/MazF family toxin [Cyanothece sp. SIO1E1]